MEFFVLGFLRIRDMLELGLVDGNTIRISLPSVAATDCLDTSRSVLVTWSQDAPSSFSAKWISFQTENFSNAQRAGKSQIHGDIQCVKVAEAQSLGNGNRFPNGFSSQFHAPLFSEYRFSAKWHFQMDFERLNCGSQHIETLAAEDQ